MNSVLIPYDDKRRIASKRLIDLNGDFTIANGSIILKKLICKSDVNIDKNCMLVANWLTHFDYDTKSQVRLYSYMIEHIFLRSLFSENCQRIQVDFQ